MGSRQRAVMIFSIMKISFAAAFVSAFSRVVFKSITDTGFVDQKSRAGRVLFNLVSQLGHVNPEILCLFDVGRSPDLLKQLPMCEHFARMLRKEGNKTVFNRSQMDFFIVQKNQSSGIIKAELVSNKFNLVLS
jgi:hypothetical protein